MLNIFQDILWFLGGWYVIGYLGTKFSGWRKMGEKYPHTGKIESLILRSQKIRMNGVWLGWILDIGVNPNYLIFHIPFFIKGFQPDLMMSWNEMKMEDAKDLNEPGVRLSFSKCPNVYIEMKNSIWEKIEKERRRLGVGV